MRRHIPSESFAGALTHHSSAAAHGKAPWHHRLDCFLVGIVVGLLSTSSVMRGELADGGLYVAVLATLTLPPLGLQLRTLDHGSLQSAALSMTWQYVLGGIAVMAGLTVGLTFGS